MTNAFRPSPDAIAITGYGCRLPGAENIDAFWDLLIDGRLAVGPVPSDRWDNERFHHPGRAMPGMSYTMQAGLLDDVWAFDPGFFGISPREAEQMDPQQRVLLEVVWEAIEHAFLTADEIAAKRCGVFIGAASMDHSLVSVAEPGVVGSNFMTGNTLSILSNRISYAFDLKGASYTVDTACSSSFYALHQAAQALRQGEIDTAIVGGVNMVLSPFHFVGFSRAAMLSPDGLCKAFDASANGYVRGEGAVAFVLRRADTLSGHEPVRSELLGTGVNSDGRTVGLSMPSEPDQARLLGRIYDDLGVDPDHLAFVEAHGTGTHVGDPIEARAIGTVLGQGRSRRLPIGSAKTNVGHLEAASGLVGLLKAQLALDHGRLPPSLHFNEPNPEIDFDGLNLTVASSPVEIDLAGADGGAPWIAGVNSFGFGGANAHAVLRQAKSAQADTVIPAAPPPPLLLSAASQASLRALANRWRERLTNCPALEAASLISANARLRTRHTHRAVLTSQGTDLTVALDALAAGEAHPAIQTGEAPERSGKTAFVFCGNGAQYADMGRELFDGDTAYRDGFLRVAKTFRRLSGIDLVKLMDDPDLAEKLDHGLVGQPLLLALQIALVEALAARGVRPDAVAGHSVGEVAAAWTAGCLSLTDACRLIHARAAAMEALRGEGGMAAVLAGAEAAEQALSEMGFETLDLAGDNSPRSSTVSGPAEDIAAFLKAAKSRRLAARPIPVSYPYHGPALEVIRDDLIAGLSALRPKPGTIPVFSSTTGAQVEGRAMDADYWWHNARDRVRFREAIVGLAEFGASTFVEIAPRPQLQTYVNDTVRSLGKKASVIPTLDTSARAPRDLVTITARAVANGAREDEAAFFGPERGPVTDLPRYAWNHAAYRIEVGENGVDLLGRRPSHPLLGWQVRQGEGVWRSELDMLKRPWLGDHVVDGAAVLPGAAFVEIALAAGAEFYDAAQVELADFDILAPLVLEESESQTTTVRTRLELETGIIRIESRPYQSSQDWVLHARGTVKRAIDPASEVPAHPGLALLPEWPGARLYALLDAAGLSYGPVFQRVRRLRAGGGWAEAELDPVAEVERYQIHPAMLDSAFHAIFPLIAAELSDRDSESGAASGLDAGETYVPVRFGRVLSLSPGTAPERADLNLVRLTEHGAEVALTLRDGSGRGLIRLEGLRLQKIRLKIGRSQPPILWQQRLIPHAGPETEAASGAAWSAAAERLEVIGLAAPDLPEPAAGALIVDAGFRRVAWDALAALADGDGRLPARPAGMAEEALPLYHAMRIALEEDDVVVQVDEDAILLDCPYPRLDELTDALISEAPERAADLMNLIRAATTLGQRLAEGPDAAAIDPVPGHVPWQRDLVDALARAAEDYAACLEDGVRLDILLIGAAPPSFVRRLIETAQPTRLILSDPEAPRVEWLRATLDPNPALTILDWDQAIASGGVDLVISAEGLGRVGRPRMAVLGDLLRPGGLLLAAERLPELGADLTQGLSAQWWSETIVPEAPLGRLSTGEEWAHALTGAGFEGAVARPLACQDVAASLITARRSTETVEQAPGVKPKTVLLGHGLGEDTLEQAFSAMGWSTERAEVADLAGRLCDVASEADAEIVAALQLDSQGGLPLDHLRSLIAASGRVWIIAEQGAPGHTRPENGSIWGLVRVAMNEAPGCDIRLIDADPSLQAAEIAAIIADPGEEREWVLSPAG
ncbi:MAG: beta-ketoacyl synthase N-terminal-like domain-containing protein, partial [Pseudomonadota bacterium]